MTRPDQVKDARGAAGNVRRVLHGEEDLLHRVRTGEIASDGVREQHGGIADLGLPERIYTLFEDTDDGYRHTAHAQDFADRGCV